MGGKFLAFKNLQQLVKKTKEITDLDTGIVDLTGRIIASTIEDEVGQVSTSIQRVLEYRGNLINMEKRYYKKVYVKNKLHYIVYMDDKGKQTLKYLSLISLNISNLKEYYDDKYDKNTLMKDIILGNITAGEVLEKSKEMHLEQNTLRVVYLIKTNKSKEIYAYDIIQSLFPNRSRDFVLVIDEETTVLVKQLKSNREKKNIRRTAKVITDTVNTELMIRAFVAMSTVVDNIMDMERAYNEARTALKIGRVFESDKSVHDYENLGIGRLIYELPKPLCRLFLKEVFKDNGFEGFDSETSLTIQKFFENSLNISETSRQLYIHRNTLVYRLDKIQKMTGLDLRRFDDAIILKIAILVKMYLDKK